VAAPLRSLRILSCSCCPCIVEGPQDDHVGNEEVFCSSQPHYCGFWVIDSARRTAQIYRIQSRGTLNTCILFTATCLLNIDLLLGVTVMSAAPEVPTSHHCEQEVTRRRGLAVRIAA